MTDTTKDLKIRLLLVDDHEIIRLGLRELFGRTINVEVVGEASNMADAVTEAKRLGPAVILMDMRLPDGSGLDACREILAQDPSARVLFLSSYSSEEAVMATVLAGAAGYLMKEIGQQTLVRAVETAARGQSTLDPLVTQAFLTKVRSLAAGQGQQSGPDALSRQECRVLNLVVEGKTNRQIGTALELSEKTVKNYLTNAFQKLQVSRRAEAAVKFARRLTKPLLD